MDKLLQGGQYKFDQNWYELYYDQLVSTPSELRYPFVNVRRLPSDVPRQILVCSLFVLFMEGIYTTC